MPSNLIFVAALCFEKLDTLFFNFSSMDIRMAPLSLLILALLTFGLPTESSSSDSNVEAELLIRAVLEQIKLAMRPPGRDPLWVMDPVTSNKDGITYVNQRYKVGQHSRVFYARLSR